MWCLVRKEREREKRESKRQEDYCKKREAKEIN